MKIKWFIGIDVSKKTLDICVMTDGKVLEQLQISNSLAAIKKLFLMLKRKYALVPSECCCCMEHTGIYNNFLLEYLWKNKYLIWLERAMQIKLSMGLIRGKSDKVDSFRIAQYASKNWQDCKLWKPERDVIRSLKAILTIRTRLINAKTQFSVPLREASTFADKSTTRLAQRLSAEPIKILQAQIDKADQEINKIIRSDERLNELFSLITTVDGIGTVVATHLIARTNEFLAYTDPRKFACYAGIAPFPYQSGTSIKGRTRVSHLANKSVKSLLHLAAMAAVVAKGDLRIYYLRKVAEGKNKMSIINAVRNKLIARIFSIVRRNEPYQKNFNHSLA